ncbi:hypothetical protein ABG067_007176 [Albugo candida]
MNTESSNDEVLIAAISDNRSRELGIAMIDLSSPHELLLWNVIDSAHHVEENLLLEELQVWGLGNRSLIIGESSTNSCAKKGIQVCFVVRAGIHGMLDVARRTYLDTIEKLHVYVQDYNQTLKIPIRLAYTDLKIDHLTIAPSVQNAPSVPIKRFVKRKSTMESLKRFKRFFESLENDVNEISGDHHDIRTHGFYVPPTALFLPLRDRVCTRFGTSNYMVENASTFGVEMTETDLILEKERKASLVLVDELGRGTASDEVCALA